MLPPFWLTKSPRLWPVAGHVGKHPGSVVGDLGIKMVVVVVVVVVVLVAVVLVVVVVVMIVVVVVNITVMAMMVGANITNTKGQKFRQ